MPIYARNNRKDYTPAPEGLHQAVCVDVIDLGLKETPWGEKAKVEIRWQIEATHEDTGKPFIVLKWYTLSLNERATLRAHLQSWRGKKFTEKEAEVFDLERLLGQNCQLQIAHNVSDNGSTFANVQAIVPLARGMTKLHPVEYVREQDREKQPGTVNGAPAGEEADGDQIPF